MKGNDRKLVKGIKENTLEVEEEVIFKNVKSTGENRMSLCDGA